MQAAFLLLGVGLLKKQLVSKNAFVFEDWMSFPPLEAF